MEENRSGEINGMSQLTAELPDIMNAVRGGDMFTLLNTGTVNSSHHSGPIETGKTSGTDSATAQPASLGHLALGARGQQIED